MGAAFGAPGAATARAARSAPTCRTSSPTDRSHCHPLSVDEPTRSSVPSLILVAGPEIVALEGWPRPAEIGGHRVVADRGPSGLARQVALDELAEGEELGRSGFTRTAQLVANNVTVLRDAASGLVAPMPSLSRASRASIVRSFPTSSCMGCAPLRTGSRLANEVFDLLTVAECQLASTRRDTRESPPAHPASAVPQGGPTP